MCEATKHFGRLRNALKTRTNSEKRQGKRMVTESLQAIDQNGFELIRSVFSQSEIDTILAELDIAIQSGSDRNIKSSLGETYAARNVAEQNPRLLEIWKKPALLSLLDQLLGQEAGLVRVLYFDKHPNRTWSLPWHKDMTIAVKDNSLPSNLFSKPTRKSGVDHVEASTDQLQQMVTLRIHLDEVTEENGPLEVAIGSHHNGKVSSETNNVHTVFCDAGDVLAMRPLISHASGSSARDTKRHRRILHLEFSANALLPDEFEWHQFFPIHGKSQQKSAKIETKQD